MFSICFFSFFLYISIKMFILNTLYIKKKKNKNQPHFTNRVLMQAHDKHFIVRAQVISKESQTLLSHQQLSLPNILSAEWGTLYMKSQLVY